MMEQLETGNIGIGNTSTLTTLNNDLGRKCFAFTKLDATQIRRLKKAAFASGVRTGK